jgi:hypothetical protein
MYCSCGSQTRKRRTSQCASISLRKVALIADRRWSYTPCLIFSTCASLVWEFIRFTPKEKLKRRCFSYEQNTLARLGHLVLFYFFSISFLRSTLNQLELSNGPRRSCWCSATERDVDSEHWRKDNSKFSVRPFVPCGCSVSSAYHSGSYRKVILVQTHSAELLAAALGVFRFLVSFSTC